MSVTKIVIVTNLYPLPWQPTRGIFNFQQFSLLAEKMDVFLLVPVAFPDWYKHRNEVKKNDRIKIVPYFYLPKFGRRFYGKLMAWSLKLLAGQWIKDIAPNKILASWAYPDGVAALDLAKKVNADFYLKVHGSDVNMHASFPPRAKQIVRMANQAKGILSVSKDLANKMVNLGVNGSLIKAIYNGVDLEKFKPLDKVKKNNEIIFVGNLKREKGVLELLDGFAKIADKHLEIMLNYIGSGPMLTILKNKVASLNLNGRVNFLGILPHEELPGIIAKAKILALPSYNEGVPNVILEAMACGTAVVATSVGGIPEVVTSDTAILSEEISADGVAKALDSAITSSWSQTKIRAHAEQFSWQRNVEQLTQLLNR